MENRDKLYKYTEIAIKMGEIIDEYICNDTYGYVRMHQALKLKAEFSAEKSEYFPHVPCERTVYRIMEHEGLVHQPKRKPNSLTKADKEAQKSDNLLKQDFYAEKPCEKAVTDITEIPCKDGKLYVAGVFDCFDNMALSMVFSNNMKADLVCTALETAVAAHRELIWNKAIVHSDRGSQYTSEMYRDFVEKTGVIQSMNSAAGRCHDNAKCESMWGRFKEELLYGRYNTERMTRNEVKTLVWRYFMGYWNNSRVCSANGGLPPAIKRTRFLKSAANLHHAA